MKKILKNYKSYIACLVVIVVAFVVVYTMKNSYALSTGVSRSGKITTSFKTNYTGTDINYMEDSSIEAKYKYAYIVPKSLKTSDNKKILYVVTKNLTVAGSTQTFESVEGNPSNVSDKGLRYIIGHGYNETNTTNTVFTNSTYKTSYGTLTDAEKQQYVTQLAIWLYIYKNKSNFTDYCEKDGKTDLCDFKSVVVQSGESNSYTYGEYSYQNVITDITTQANKTNYKWLNYALKLVDEAETYKGKTAETPKMKKLDVTFTFDNDYTKLISSTITPTSQNDNSNYMYYSVEITDPNEYGAYIVNSNNEKITNMNKMSGSFKLVIPLKEDVTTMNLASVELNIYGVYVHGTEAYAYRVTTSSLEGDNIDKHPKYSDVISGYVPTNTVKSSLTAPNFTKITKLDAANSKELPGATLVVTKKDDSTFKEEWVSTDEPHYLFLENGEYQLCETIAPKGYKKKEECIDFTIDGTKVVGVTMENEVEIENTGASSSKTLLIIGSMVLILGAGTIVLVSKKQKDVK